MGRERGPGLGLFLVVAAAAAAQGPDLRIEPLAPGLYRHVTTLDPDGTRMPTNGLLVVGPAGSLLVDTGWHPHQARALLEHAATRLGAPVRVALITHFHQDRSGGVAALRQAGVPVRALPETLRRLGVPGIPLAAEDRLREGLEVFFPGPGHSPENLVCWHPASATLFGGCFLKGPEATDLGNLADADPRAWVGSLARVRARWLAPARVVPGHGEPGGPGLPGHTRALLAAYLRPGPRR